MSFLARSGSTRLFTTLLPVVGALLATALHNAPALAAKAERQPEVTTPTVTPITAPPTESLVSDETIATERRLTSVHKLKNGIPVIVREIPDSDILQINVNFATGLKDLKPGRKALNEWLWNVLPMGGKGYPREKVYQLSEKFGFELACTGGIELASCGLGTLNEYWKEGLPLLAALIKTPSITADNAKLTKDRLVAKLKNASSDPGQYINEVINSTFYPQGHPYRLNSDEALAELAKLTPPDVAAYHKEVLNAGLMSIVVVTSMPAKKVVADLDKAFGSVVKKTFTPVVATPPEFEDATAYKFNDRSLPTAYIRLKLNAPAVTAPDAVATRVLYEILSEELGEEIRTKRSLSYAVGSFLIQYSVGVGVISASTSKPEETLAAMHDVLQKLKSKTYDASELTEYKHVFATTYYLTQETHASLAGALAAAHFYYGDANMLYEMPRKLDAVTGADIKRLAGELLVNPRVAVIFGRDDFKDAWAKDLISKNLGPAAAKKSH